MSQYFDENFTKVANRFLWVAMLLLALGYISMGGAYVGGAAGGHNSTAFVRPAYDLVGYVPSYVTAGLARPFQAGQDTLYVDRTLSTSTYLRVNVYEHGLGLVIVLAILYAVPSVLMLMDTKSREDEDKVAESASVVYSLATIVAWNVIQPDIMYILGNNDKTAHWLVTCGLVAMVALYHATENDMINGIKQKKSAAAAKAAALDANTGGIFGSWVQRKQSRIFVLSFLVGAYLISVVVGVAILTPLSYIDFNIVSEPYRYVITTFLTWHFLDFLRFLFSLGYNMSDDRKFKTVAGFFTGSPFAAFMHVWLFVVVGLYLFFPRTQIGEAGLL